MTPLPPLPVALAALLALALAGCQRQETDEVFGKRVHAYLMANPEVIREAVARLNDKERVAAMKSASGLIRKYRAQLERDPRDVVLNPNGGITLVEFFDYRCGYCKSVTPEVLHMAQNDPDIRLVLKEFPIFGEVSETAARVALTPQAKAKGAEVYRRLMAERALDDVALDRNLAAVGIDPAQARKAADSPAIRQQIADIRALAHNLNLEGTPAFVVGDTLIPGADIGALRAAVLNAKASGLKRP